MADQDRRRDAEREAVKQIHYLAAALKAPRITEAAARLADQARDAGWTHEDYLAAVLEREVSARNASGAELRIRAAGFGARKTLEDFDFDAQPAVRQQIAALASGGFLTEARNVVLLGPPGTGKTHLATALGVAAAHHGHRVLFATATDWVTRLTDAHRAGRLPARARPAAPLRTDHRRRGRLPPLRARRREPVLPARLIPLRTRLADPDQQPAVQRLGRRLRRPSRRRRDDRPHRPPRRRPHPQRRQLPAPQPRHRHPAQHQNPRHGRLETTNRWPRFRPSYRPHFRALPTLLPPVGFSLGRSSPLQSPHGDRRCDPLSSIPRRERSNVMKYLMLVCRDADDSAPGAHAGRP